MRTSSLKIAVIFSGGGALFMLIILFQRIENTKLGLFSAIAAEEPKYTPEVAKAVPKITKLHEITVFLRLTSNKEHKRRLYCYFLRTYVLFWPENLPSKTVLVLDQESLQDHEFGVKLINKTKSNFPNLKFDVQYEPLPMKSVLEFPGSPKPPGYNRQLWSSFFIDKYTDDDVIAWMDTDAAFTFPVTTSSIFNGGKLRAIGSECSVSISWVQTWATTTELALGVPMIADFMIYFPVYILRDTFTNCRNHILKRFKTNDFAEAFKGFYKGYISPVCIILSYAWHFERDRYDWSFKLCSSLTDYNKKFSKEAQIPPENANAFLPQPQTAFHYCDVDFLMSNIRMSYCLVKGSGGNPIDKCPGRDIALNRSLVLFNHDLQRVNNPEDTPCLGEHRESCLRTLEECFRNIKGEIAQGLRKVDWRDLETVDKLAKEDGIQCTTIP
ncbi:predicted protein [Nematostella vectensis]|uniref:Uncharacterized protein n=1 Tax=Nematostella vectensis TaxID=45351 RepID=A7SLS7_NEMVE|nr:uncharacterized protein LOC5506768 [Nematostella vectensis]EDO35365.1 predicted protein [Nematostella vectensis]|eukprot:XP_001627465.1 predicted protein [Nematostella vectensis]